MKLEIKRMYDAIKAIEIEELKKKVEAIGGSYKFDDTYVFVDYEDSDSNIREGFVEKVFVENDKVFLLVGNNDTYEYGTRIDCECVCYGHLSCVADEIQYPRSLWMRIGCTVCGTKEQMDTMLRGEDYRLAEYTLKDMLNNGQIDIDGSCYVPEKCIEDYNEEYDDDVEVGDIDFG